MLIEFVCGPGAGAKQLTAITLTYQQVAGEVPFHESVAFMDIMRADTQTPVPMDPIVARHLTIVKTVEPGAMPRAPPTPAGDLEWHDRREARPSSMLGCITCC